MTIKYSPMEQKILDAIPKNGDKISTLQLIPKVYDPQKTPRNARQSLLDCANKLIQKTDDNKESFEIWKSKPRGSQPVYFWIETRKEQKENISGFEDDA